MKSSPKFGLPIPTGLLTGYPNILIGEILYPHGEPNPLHEEPQQLMRDLLLFKLFNRVETWEHWLATGVSPQWEDFDWAEMTDLAEGLEPPRFNAAYITPMWVHPPGYIHETPMKTVIALQTIDFILKMGLAYDLIDLPAHQAYNLIHEQPNFGPFLSYQILTDLGLHRPIRLGRKPIYAGRASSIGRDSPGIRN